jgi:sporulation-control protein spo0M
MVFSRLGAMLGMGAAQVELELPTAQYYRGSEVRGSVVLLGGRVPQRVRQLTVDLYEYWITGHGKNRQYHQRSHEHIVLGEYIPVEPGFQQQYAFRVRLPDTARCSRRREGWEVRASGHIPWSVDTRASAPLRVTPHPEVLAVQRAARDWLKLQPLEWDGSRPEVMYNFAAPPQMRHALDGIRLRMTLDEVSVHVELDANKQERSLKDRLGALVGADHEEIPLAIARSELITKRGSPRPAGACPHLAAAIGRLGLVAPPLPDATGVEGGAENGQ